MNRLPKVLSRRLVLRPLDEADHPNAHRIIQSCGIFPKAPQAHFIPSLLAGSFAHVSVELRRTKRFVGVVSLRSHSSENGHAELGVVVEPEFSRTGLGIEACMLVLQQVFTGQHLRKVYVRASEVELTQFSGIERFGTKEGVLRSHVVRGNALLDVFVYGIYPDQFLTAAKPLLDGFLRDKPTMTM